MDGTCRLHQGFTNTAVRRKSRYPSYFCVSRVRGRIGDGFGDEHAPDKANARTPEPSRRQIVLNSVNLAILGSAISADGTTIVNSILGAYGLPQLKASRGYRVYDDDPDYRFVFEYPSSWVGRTNTLRDGVYFSDFNTADKAVGEVYPLDGDVPPEGSLINTVIQRFISPTAQTGGDARLMLPNERLIKAEPRSVDGLEYTYLTFPSSTTTRSGYDIRRKNFGVAILKNGTVYSLVASARSDQFNKDKEEQLRHIVESFRVR